LKKIKLIIRLLAITFLSLGVYDLIKEFNSKEILFFSEMTYLLQNNGSVIDWIRFFFVSFLFEIRPFLFVISGLGLLLLKNWGRVLTIIISIYYTIAVILFFAFTLLLNTAPLGRYFYLFLYYLISNVFFLLISAVYLSTRSTKEQFLKKEYSLFKEDV
jgi:hypothetical protein